MHIYICQKNKFLFTIFYNKSRHFAKLLKLMTNLKICFVLLLDNLYYLTKVHFNFFTISSIYKFSYKFSF